MESRQDTKLYTTAGVAPHDRLAYWREAVCDSYVQLGCDAAGTRDFQGEITLQPVRHMTVSRVGGTAQRVARRKRDIGRASDAYFLLSLQLEGSCLVEQNARLAELSVGDFALYSSTDPYVLLLPETFRQLVLQVPRAALLERLPDADRLTGTRVAGTDGTAAAIRNSMLMLVECVPTADSHVRACLEDSLVDLMATGLAGLGHRPLQLRAPAQTALVRARAYIADHIADPDLDRTQVARATGMSVRRLNELFQTEDMSIADAIREARLTRVATDLRDPRCATDTISTIAWRHGVHNLEHFSQAFRRRFGLSPRAYRANGQG